MTCFLKLKINGSTKPARLIRACKNQAQAVNLALKNKKIPLLLDRQDCAYWRKGQKYYVIV